MYDDNEDEYADYYDFTIDYADQPAEQTEEEAVNPRWVQLIVSIEIKLDFELNFSFFIIFSFEFEFNWCFVINWFWNEFIDILLVQKFNYQKMEVNWCLLMERALGTDHCKCITDRKSDLMKQEIHWSSVHCFHNTNNSDGQTQRRVKMVWTRRTSSSSTPNGNKQEILKLVLQATNFRNTLEDNSTDEPIMCHWIEWSFIILIAFNSINWKWFQWNESWMKHIQQMNVEHIVGMKLNSFIDSLSENIVRYDVMIKG